MKVTRDVIVDLWPVYESGEASADTSALVEEFLEGDPDFARLVREQGSLQLLHSALPALPSDHESVTLARTKRLLRYREQAIVYALLCTTVAAILRQYRWVMIVLAVVATGAWLWLWLVTRRLRVKGL